MHSTVDVVAWQETMSAFHTLAALLAVAAVFRYVNHRWIGLPPAIALMAISGGCT